MTYDVVALGEALIDFTPSGISPAGMMLFERNPGGAPANVLCALANLGLRTAFIGKVGQDMHGEFLRNVLMEKHVDTGGLILDSDVFTTLAFVELSESGERSFSFARKPGADTRLRPDELSRERIQGCRVFHFGSLSLTNEPAGSATLAAVRMAKEAGALISYDPNYRAPLWPDRQTAIQTMRSVLGEIDLIKISDDELELITGETSVDAAAKHLLEKGAGCVVITMGSRGAFAATARGRVHVPAPAGPVVDTTGAGDSFWGGFLYQIIRGETAPADLCEDALVKYTRFANKVATICVGRRGAIPAMPTLEEVLAYQA